MSNDLEIVLGEIKGLRSDVREDQSKIWDAIEDGKKEQTDLKLENERRKAESKALDVKAKITEGAFIRHVNNGEKHHNPFFNETYLQKMVRKKQEIGTSITLGGIIFGIILAAANYFGWV